MVAARLRLDTSRAAIGLGEDDQPNALQTRLVIAATKGDIRDLWVWDAMVLRAK